MGMKKGRIISIMIVAILLLLAGCSRSADREMIAGSESQSEGVSQKTVIGFSQVGAESDWRSANTQSMKDTFTSENGYELIVEDGQQKQSNQIMAIRKFIQQEVDYIILAPVVETGWDTVLHEAKSAGIPVIIVDRMIDTEDQSLYVAWVGSDFELEGRKAGEWINQFLQEKNIAHANIVDIQGNLGATAQIGRTAGLTQVCETNENMTLIASEAADFTQARAREVMTGLLTQYSDINIAYCENDNEAFGVIEAIEAAGKTAGGDIANGEIMVVSFDGVNKEALKDVQSGKIACIAECNPNHGPLVKSTIEALKADEAVERFSYVEGALLVHDNTVSSISVDGVEYTTTVVDEAQIEGKQSN